MQSYTKHFFGHETLSWRQKLYLDQSREAHLKYRKKKKEKEQKREEK